MWQVYSDIADLGKDADTLVLHAFYLKLSLVEATQHPGVLPPTLLLNFQAKLGQACANI